MSRRRGEFEHRTSIFEGAFRAWSHLGGLDPESLETKPAAELDPLTSPIDKDTRSNNDAQAGPPVQNPDGSKRRIYPYEPLPRSGLAHPYVQAILSPWLGPDADGDAIQLGLTTLRTWWQHRRKGESGSAIAALGTDKMRGIVEGYTRHFFNLAHCLIMNDKEQPPRTLHAKMKELEKIRNKRNKKRARDEQAGKLSQIAVSVGISGAYGADNPAAVASMGIQQELNLDQDLSPLERLHAAQRRQLAESGGIATTIPGMGNDINTVPLVQLKGKCIPGKIDLPSVVSAVNHHATQLAHRGVGAGGGGGGAYPMGVTSGGHEQVYGDPTVTPVVFVSHNGDIQISFAVDGITCAHCVKIVETVLKGCNGNKSPIDGLLDAAADRVLCKVLVKIDKASNAKRISFEAARNLAMVGYTAKPKEMSIIDQTGEKKADIGALSAAFEVIATTDPQDFFNWSIPCTCPDNGILREDCSRHSQMNTRIFDAFETREKQVSDYMAGCGSKYGMPCTCGPGCRCANCSEHCNSTKNNAMLPPGADLLEPLQSDIDDQMMGPPLSELGFGMNSLPNESQKQEYVPATRNPSIISFGGNMRHMSITSEATFGRAMSGLSALSIDWENMDDFDVNVDHSSHINNAANNNAASTGMFEGFGGGSVGGRRRSSLRRSHIFAAAQQAAASDPATDASTSNNNNSNAQPHVSFQV